MKKWLALLLFLTPLLPALAQANYPTEGDFMTSEGKIYVVMAVVVTIVLGIFFYLLRLDIKLSRLEKNK
jgi:hypothetical protein